MSIVLFGALISRHSFYTRSSLGGMSFRAVSGLGGRRSFLAISGLGGRRYSFRAVSDFVYPSRLSFRAVSDFVYPSRLSFRAVSVLDGSGLIRLSFRSVSELGDAGLSVAIPPASASVSIDGVDIARSGDPVGGAGSPGGGISAGRGGYLSLNMTFSREQVHDTIDISCVGRDVYILFREKRLRPVKIELAGVEYNFIAETITGDERSFRVWGRSLSALDEGYAAEADIVLDDYASARETAERMLTENTLEWLTDDFQLKPGWSYQGPPVSGVKAIAGISGAIVRAGTGGSISVCDPYTVRPVNLRNAEPDIEFNDTDHIFVLSVSDEIGEGFNAVRVIPEPVPDDPFLLELEPAEKRPMGSDVFVRLNWPRENIPETLKSITTQGEIEYLEEIHEEIEEDIEFTGGAASVRYPIAALESITFYPASAREVDYDLWGTGLRISDAYALARVKYMSRFHRFKVSGHNIQRLLIAFQTGMATEELLFYTGGTPEIECEPIQDGNLTGLAVKRRRAMNLIDTKSYDRRIVTLETPHIAHLSDGMIAAVNDAGADLAGNYYISSVTVDIGEVAVTDSIEVCQWRV